MKLTSRMKFALMQRCIINMVFLVVLVSVAFFYLYVEIQQYEVMKVELSEDYNHYADIQKNGVHLQSLVAALRKSGQLQDSYLRNVFSQVTPQFYQKHFTNDTDQSFDAFLDTKNSEIDRIKSTPEYQERYRVLDGILPVYSPGIKITKNDMTNAQFINNVENLLYSFNLTHRGEIGIQSLSLVESSRVTTTTQTAQDNNLEENIFMIPLELTVE